jgi:biotin carboxyl carrier protein
LVSEQKHFSKIALENGVFETNVTRKFSLRKPYERQDPGVIKAVIPGLVTEIATKAGNSVKQGETLMILEAMKMLNRIAAPIDGTVSAIYVSVGEKVTKGQVLIEVESSALLVKDSRRRPRKL